MNQFNKYLTIEQRLHIQVCDYLDLQYKDALYMHPMNEGKRTFYEQFLCKKLRMATGFPDIMVFEARSGFHGAVMELKIKPNKLTAKQSEVLENLKLRGWHVAVIYNFEEAKKFIDEYLK